MIRLSQWFIMLCLWLYFRKKGGVVIFLSWCFHSENPRKRVLVSKRLLNQGLLDDRCLSFLPLCCLPFFDLRIPIAPLLSSNTSWTKIYLSPQLVVNYSTTKTGPHDIAEILLKVTLNTIKSINQSTNWDGCFEHKLGVVVGWTPYP